ncbi:MAG: restriction endonuclease subunit S [Clostridium sp.]|nr:restriction endonuclease subunit S [Clostridium sp.]
MTRQMKDSGVEWIGEIPADWEMIRAKNIFNNYKEIVGDKVGDFERLSLTLNGVLKRAKDDSKGLQSESLSTYQILREKELVFKMIDLENVNTSRVGYSPYTGLVSPVYIIFNNEKFSKYGYYYFYNMWQRAIFNQLGNNGVRSALNASDMLNIPFPMVSEDEANRIANFLDEKVGEIDSVITRTKETIEDYKKYKQTIITDAVTKGLNLDVEMKESGIEWLGDIPRNWSCMKLKHVVEKIGDIDHYMPETQSQGVPYVMTGDLQDLTSKIDFEKCKKVSYEDFQELSNKVQVNYGDVILARYATIGTVSYVDINKEFLVSYSCVIIKPTHFLKGKFLFYYAKTFSFIEELKKYTNSNTQGNVGIDSLYQAKIVLPSVEEQENIIAYLDKKCSEIDKLIAKKEELLVDLESYKKSLIYEYVTGKKEAE